MPILADVDDLSRARVTVKPLANRMSTSRKMSVLIASNPFPGERQKEKCIHLEKAKREEQMERSVSHYPVARDH